MMKVPNVAIQGQPGSFHYEAAERLLGPQFDALDCETFPEVFAAVTDGRVDWGVVAIENNSHGPINEVTRLILQHELWVSAEVFLHIEQYLIGAPGRTPADVQTVMSQAPALSQCEQWLAENMPHAHKEERQDTAESVQYAMNHPGQPLAAIASKRAAEIYGGQLLVDEPINDDPLNNTRFFLLSKEKIKVPDPTRTSIILETNHGIGDLYNAIGTFYDAGVNLSRLISHPIRGDKRHYSFYVDFDAGLDEHLNHPALDAIREQRNRVRILGTYVGADSL
jgi:prephenate dehydratase